MIKIDKNIPFVESKACTSKYPFNKMNIGDSFLVEVQDERNRKHKELICLFSSGNYTLPVMVRK
jgi:hypothetical protein